MDDVRAHLASRPKEALVDLLLERAVGDATFRRKLIAEAAAATGGSVDVEDLRASIDLAVEPEGFVDWREAPSWASEVHEAIDSLDDLLRAGHAAEAAELAEHAVWAVEEAAESVHDDGEIGSILYRLEALHLAACRKARPDPEELADRLLRLELSSELGAFSGAAETYARVLGKRGLTAYRRLAESEWAKVPALGPGEGGGYDRFRITKIMEALARDVDELVSVLSRALASPHDYLGIARALQDAGRADDALAWAERGIAVFPERPGSDLRELVAGEYQRRGRHAEAMEQAWANFADRPGLDAYEKLSAHAGLAGGWPAWRTRALALLRSEAELAARTPSRWGPRPDRSTLVRVFLWEGDVEAAWEGATAGGCSDDLWQKLLSLREAEHPDECLPEYRRLIERTLAQKNNAAYGDAVALLERVKSLIEGLGRAGDFGSFVAEVRSAHRPKRNFMKLLDARSW